MLNFTGDYIPTNVSVEINDQKQFCFPSGGKGETSAQYLKKHKLFGYHS
jgi:hypothetical protein